MTEKKTTSTNFQVAIFKNCIYMVFIEFTFIYLLYPRQNKRMSLQNNHHNILTERVITIYTIIIFFVKIVSYATMLS
jgi:hypothetical protein